MPIGRSVVLLVVLCSLLSGCLITQLRGRVGGSTVSVSPLSEPTREIVSTRTHSHQSILASVVGQTYPDQSDVKKLQALGAVVLDQNLFENDLLYVVTAAGGFDYDANQDLAIDQQPRSIQGQWHAIIPGYAFALKTTHVSVLTEAAFQWLMASSSLPLDQREAEGVIAALDDASRRILGDINGDGAVSYADLLMWDPVKHADKYRGDRTHLDIMYSTIGLGLEGRLARWAGYQLITGESYHPREDESLVKFLLNQD